MKKLLPLVAFLALGSFTSQAESEVSPIEKIPFTMISHVSPNGEWAVSCGDGTFYVINLNTEDVYTSEGDDDQFLNAGYGNAISDNGVVVGSMENSGGAAYWQITPENPDGAWNLLPVLSTASNAAHGITPDGSRIVGYSMNSGVSYYDDGVVLSVPLLWQLNEDGEYDMIKLPYPTTDFTGRTPQYVIALAISDDGKRIIGQVTDNAGFVHSPIVYNEQADGSWTFEYVNPELQTAGLQFPEWPGEYSGPSYPYYTSFMSEEEQAAYEEAQSNWSYSSGEKYPVATDYMTEDEIAAYNQAKDEYNEAYGAYSALTGAFYDVYYQALEEGLGDVLMNSVAISNDGHYYAATKATGDYFSGYSYTPLRFDLNTGDYKIYSNATASPTYVNNEGAMLGCTAGLDGYTRFAWVKPADDDQWTRLPQFVAQHNTAAADWMFDNLSTNYIKGYASSGDDDDDWGMLLSHKADGVDDSFGGYGGDDDFGGFGGDDNFGGGDDSGSSLDPGDWEEDGYIWSNDVFDGLPMANKDMSVITTWEINGYSENDDDYEYSLIIRLPELSGVKSIATTPAKSLSVKASRDGVITINGDAAKLEVFSIAGNKVLSISSPSATTKTNLTAGMYLIKATAANGKSTVTKAVIAK